MLNSFLMCKIKYVMFMAAIIGASQMCLAAEESAPEGAKIEVINDTADFGDVSPKTTHSYSYKFKNVGSERLIISRIQSTCGCTVPELNKKEYDPGESGEIKISFTSSSRDGTELKHLYIHSNDATNPRYPLVVKCNTVLKVVVEPQRLELAVVEENAGFESLKVFSREGKEFAITSIIAAGSPFKFNYDPDKKAVEHIIKPKVDISALKNNLSGVINIRTDYPGAVSLVVPYNTQPEFSASPARIIVQNAVSGEKHTRDIWVKNNYGRDIEIVGIKSVKNDIVYEIVDNKNGMAMVKLTIDVPEKEGKTRYFTDDIIIDIAGAEDITVKVSGWYAR